MGMKRGFCLLFACIAIFSCIPAQAAAADIGEQAAEIAEPRATGEFDFEISAKSMHQLSDGIWGNRYHYGILFSGVSECRLWTDRLRRAILPCTRKQREH